jgi:transcriptional regulator with XRE-family HTH domain
MIVDRPVNDFLQSYKVRYVPMDGERAHLAEARGRRMKKAREAQALSVRQLAKILNVSPAVISKWENGQTESYDAEILLRLCMRLYTTPQQILWGEDDDPWLMRHPALAPRKRHPGGSGR